ncbi:hypothetical protein O1611_g10558 [Lasiodiplodia mahajangana]|uniref:Uncharacterized protein n=1 Tax=Lasiodiplodia mahajangana TaxID=1108764 RepID=A0ACC2IX09_9PEZI|nr:hypothetical protein O1611_g10558 [Lasiodiplodia mahajangana]
MATQEKLFDTTKLASNLLGALKGISGQDVSSFNPTVVKLIRTQLEMDLKEYNEVHRNTHLLYTRSVEEAAQLRASLTRQIDDLRKQIKEERIEAIKNNDRNVEFYIKSRDEVTRAADLEREEMAKVREDMNNERANMKERMEQLRKQIQEAQSDRNVALMQLEKQQNRTADLRQAIERLEHTNKEYLEEIRGWKGETYKVTEMKEHAEAQCVTMRAQLNPLKEKNLVLTEEVAQLGEQLEKAGEKIEKQEIVINDLNDHRGNRRPGSRLPRS